MTSWWHHCCVMIPIPTKLREIDSFGGSLYEKGPPPIALLQMYGVEQSFTSPYNPCGNAICECFNRTLFRLLKTLKAEEKVDWPSHLPALVFTYNATPYASTGYQPYQLMFGRWAPAPCDNWLGIREYNNDKSVTHIDWIDQQLEHLVQANKRAQKNIKASNAKNKKVVWVKTWSYQLGI